VNAQEKRRREEDVLGRTGLDRPPGGAWEGVHGALWSFAPAHRSRRPHQCVAAPAAAVRESACSELPVGEGTSIRTKPTFDSQGDPFTQEGEHVSTLVSLGDHYPRRRCEGTLIVAAGPRA